MSNRITRRDFLNGVALAVVAGAAPRDLFALDPRRYPPALAGLRGQTDAAYAFAHKLAFEGATFRLGGMPVEERYDLVVVGAGLSGLAAAHFYRQRYGADRKILILDSLEDFGGHAKRNEFQVDGRTLIGYGGSESLQSPKANFSAAVNTLLGELGVDVSRFEQYFKSDTYPALGLSRASFFDRDRYQADKLVTGDPTDWVSDDIPRAGRNGRALEAFIGDFPLSDAARAGLLELYTSKRVTLENLEDAAARADYLARKSYVEFLRSDWGLDEEAIGYFHNRSLDFFGLSPAMLSAAEAGAHGYPGLQGIALPVDEEAAGEMEEPYIHHFPDGNASLARLLVRKLIPGVAPGTGMDDVVLAPFDYAKLDRPDAPVRLRLEATAVRVVNSGAHVELGYFGHADQRLHRVRARHCVLACFNMVIPYILAGLPEAQSAALKRNVKAPLVYTNVAVRNWQPWVKLGVHEIFGVGSFHSRVKLDYPVVMGGYAGALNPEEPILIHMVHVPVIDALAIDARAQLRAARATLLTKPFEDYERALRQDLSRMLGPGGFDAERDIAGITVNRWSHGYAWGANTLYETEDEAERTMAAARRPVGNVTIANSDAAWSAYAHSAIDEAHRAVAEFKG